MFGWPLCWVFLWWWKLFWRERNDKETDRGSDREKGRVCFGGRSPSGEYNLWLIYCCVVWGCDTEHEDTAMIKKRKHQERGEREVEREPTPSFFPLNHVNKSTQRLRCSIIPQIHTDASIQDKCFLKAIIFAVTINSRIKSFSLCNFWHRFEDSNITFLTISRALAIWQWRLPVCIKYDTLRQRGTKPSLLLTGLVAVSAG